jgi:hypothetical protein
MEDAKLYIEQTRTGLIEATHGLLEAQWNFKPAADRWSIAEILEHVVLTQELVLGPVRERLADAPPAPADHDPAEVDALIVGKFPNRIAKFQGPPVLHPTGSCTPAEALARLDDNCIRLAEYLDSPDLRQHAAESMPLKAISGGKFQVMDGYQWGLAIAAHTARHTHQIAEVKEDAGYPAAESRAVVA